MERRHFIRSSLALTTSVLSASMIPMAAWAGAADKVLGLGMLQALTDLETSGGSHQPWASAFAGAEKDFEPLAMTLEGCWPKALRGKLYRNGPAKMQRGNGQDKESYRHWFDGDGMIQEFSLEGGSVHHRGKFVQTKKFKLEEQQKAFRYPVAGTLIKHPIPIRNNDDMNVANTSVIPWRGELLALWEAGSAHRLDVSSLETIGIKDFGDNFKAMPFSAHPLPDGSGGMWNFAAWFMDGRNRLVIYHVGSDDKIDRIETVELPQASYLHAFAQSENKLVFYISSCVYEQEQGQTYVDSFKWRPDLSSKLLIIDKQDLSQQDWAEMEPGFVFHFGQAIERDNILHVQMSLYPDADILLEGMKALIEGKHAKPSANAELVTVSVPLQGQAKLKAKIKRSGIEMEFPQFTSSSFSKSQPHHMKHTSEGFSSLYGVGSVRNSAQVFSGLSNTLYRLNDDDTHQAYYLGEGVIAEEPLLVTDSEGSEYVLMTALDYLNSASRVLLFDCGDIEKGPIAQASMNRILPLGFHGCFTASERA